MKPSAVGYYNFAGSMVLGFRGSFAVGETWEPLDVGLEVAERNLPGLKIFKSALDVSDPDLVFGNPPCHGFARVNTMNRGVHHPDNKHMLHFADAAVRSGAKIGVFDMVPGLMTTGIALFWKIADIARDEGYSITVVRTDAADVGVPHHRKRLAIIIHRVAIDVPPASGPIRTLDDAIYDLRGMPLQWGPQEYLTPPLSEFQRIVRWKRGTQVDGDSVTEHQVVNHKYDQLVPYMTEHEIRQAHRVPWDVLTEMGLGRPYATPLMRWGEPAYTVTGQQRLLHPDGRWVSMREASRLMTYPDWWQFGRPGDTRPVQRHWAALGKATPPLLAAEMARYLADAVERNRPIMGGGVAMITRQLGRENKYESFGR